MSQLTRIFSIAFAAMGAGLGVPTAAQTIAYEDVVTSAYEDVLLADVSAPEPLATTVPQITYEIPVEMETQRSVTVRQHAPRIKLDKPAVERVQYGPFRVSGEGRVELVGLIDSATPSQFAQLLRDHPDTALLEMVEAPGTVDDIANFRLARMVREQGIVTYVPAHGSVRSGAVELFLAGSRRIAHRNAEFAVHSWMDIYGREAGDFAKDDPVNRAYIDYYVEMGITEDDAQRFYDMTNSVPHYGARWLTAGELSRYVPIERTS